MQPRPAGTAHQPVLAPAAAPAHGDTPAPSTVADPGTGSSPSALQVVPDSFIGQPPSPAATPELDSLTLLGSGLLGLGGYALLRLRARRR